MSLVNFTNLDFDQIKTSITDYLRSNSNFTDYDFEGSNLSILIDVLAYNTYISSYNANMISNEVFIDSATLRENVVALARNVGYTPRSRVSSKITASFFVNTSNLTTRPVALTLQRGIVASSASNQTGSYTFCTLNDITVPVVNDVAFFNNITLHEGTYVSERFTVDNSIANQRYILSNPYIDFDTIQVIIRDSSSSSKTRKFSLSKSLFSINPESTVFFIQEVEDQRYELIFGDNIFGKKLDTNNIIEVSYVVCNGESSNGISRLLYNGRILDNNSRVVTSAISQLTTKGSSINGQEIEDIDSIKRYATQIYSAQNRAVTSLDYEVIVKKIYPEAESITVFGGETLTPPKYGKVFISIKPESGPFLSNQVKDNIKRELRKFGVAGIVPEIMDLKYLYLELDTTAYFDQNKTSSSFDLQTKIINNIISYANSSNLNKYGARFKYSKFLKLIDDTNDAITSNITKVIMRRDLLASINNFATYEICYGNSFHIKSELGFNIKSSGFIVGGVSETVYMTDIPETSEYGKIVLFKLVEGGGYQIVRKNSGKIDYVKGEIILYPTNIIDTSKKVGSDSIIEISAISKSNDIIGLQDLYIQLDTSRLIVNMLPDNISSGSDISGTNYLVTSSYTNGNLIRL